ncbi:hypothetical protein CVT25_003683 [Psilocybe cyanescens]|uniref:Uncharacterized protein n=1 Tax=Psilocybe cyanescens TaxID=93625 RepID=A0A409WP57_PSICY|nr:hypothetical protein CVT25_003683 [Psilocybe cyanescens]
MGTMNVSQLNYVADLCESALYGAFSLLILVVIWILLTAKKMTRIYKVMFWASIVMWALTTAHLGLLIQRLSFAKTTLWEAKAAVSLVTVQFMISDMILVWRVYAVWGRNYWTTLIPIILMIGAAAVRFSVVSNGAEVLLFVSDPANFIIIANTMYCTILIAGRICYLRYSNDEGPTRGKQNMYERVLLMIIESGALYALSMIIAIIVDKVHSPGIHVILDITMPLSGILPTLILLVVHFELVPDTRFATSNFALATNEDFQAASGPTVTATEDCPTNDEVESRKTASTSTLKTEHSAFSLLILVVIWILLTTKGMSKIHKVMFWASILMWVLATVHLGLLIQRLSLGTTTLWEVKMAVSVVTLQFMISDLILIWRVYAVWNRDYRPTIIPAILMIGAAAVRFCVVVDETVVLPDPADFINIANTLYCTASIAGRISYLQCGINEIVSTLPIRGKRNVYEGALLMIIESGALYTLSLIVAVIVDKVHSPGIHVILNITMPLTGILPTLILLLVYFELVPGTRASTSSSALMASDEFKTDSGPNFVEGCSRMGEAIPERADNILKVESSDDEIQKKCNRCMV